MITPAQLIAETNILTKLLNDPRFANPAAQEQIMHALDVLAWVKDQTPPMSQMIVDELNQGLI